MASTPPQLPPAIQQRPVKPKTEVPDEVAEIVSKSLQVGASTGSYITTASWAGSSTD